MTNEPIVKKKKLFFIVWLMPLLALLLGSWMVYSYYQNKGIEIVITLKDGDGIEVNKTPLLFNGIKLGKVTAIAICPTDISKVDVTVTIPKKAVGIPRQGNMFWKVAPKVSLTEVTGLNALLSGAYLEAMPVIKDIEKVKKLPFQTHFIALDTPPVNTFEPGLIVTMLSDEADLQTGAPVLFKKLPVGRILKSSLTAQGVQYTLHIDEKYKHLIQNNSIFWKISGIELRASLAGIYVQMDSLASLVTGGIQFDSPPNGQAVTAAQPTFQLFDNQEDAQLSSEIITLTTTNGYNIDKRMSHIYYNGIQAGKIVSIDYNPAKNNTIFKIQLTSSFQPLANQDAYFWIVKPHIGLTKLEGLDAIASGAYITFNTTSNSAVPKRNFTLNDAPPSLQGIHVKVISDKGNGLSSGSNIIYRDIAVGIVNDVSLARDGMHTVYDVIIATNYKHLLNDTSRFVLQKSIDMGASFEGVHVSVPSVSSIVNGGITLETKNLSSKLTKSSFVLIESQTKLQEQEYTQEGGKMFLLTSPSLGSLKKGSPVIYKGIKVGKVIDYTLNKKTNAIDIKVYIEQKYAGYINASTTFYNLSGIQMKADLSGVTVAAGSLETIVGGGVGFTTPLKADEVKEMDHFKLYDTEQAAKNQYITIHLTSKDLPEIKEGAKITYKSIVIGRIESLEIEGDEIDATALIDQRYKRFLVNDTLFWPVDATIKINGVKNASTIISGSYVTLMPGKSKTPRQTYAMLDRAPVDSIHKEGLRIKLIGTRLHGISEGTPLFYRQIQIGNVEKYTLKKDATGVEMTVFIDACHAHLVRQNSLFYNATVLGMDVGLFSAKLRTETISTMVNGGIVLATPTKYGAPTSSMETFKLYDDAKDEWREWEPTLIGEEKCGNKE